MRGGGGGGTVSGDFVQKGKKVKYVLLMSLILIPRYTCRSENRELTLLRVYIGISCLTEPLFSVCVCVVCEPITASLRSHSY